MTGVSQINVEGSGELRTEQVKEISLLAMATWLVGCWENSGLSEQTNKQTNKRIYLSGPACTIRWEHACRERLTQGVDKLARC